MTARHRPARAARTAGAALVALVLLAAPACGDDDDDPSSTTTTTAAEDSTTTDGEGTITDPPLDDQSAPAGTNGLAFAEDGTLWIADIEGDQIIAVDPGTGAILHRLGPDAGISTPDDLAFDADGRLWWTDNQSGEVGRVDDPFADDAESEVITQVGPGLNPITVAPDGRIFVGAALNGQGLWELDPEQPDPRVIDPSPGDLNAFQVGDDGLIYAPLMAVEDGQVITIDPDTGETAELVGGLSLNVAVRLDPDGRVVVLEATPPTLSVVEDGELTPLATLTTEAGDNFAFASDGSIFVSSFNQPTVDVVAPDGSVSTLTIGEP